MADKLLTTEEAAEIAKVEPKYIGEQLRRCLLRGYKLGNTWRIEPDDFQAWLNRHANRPAPRRRG